jgi:hypothetical protein
VTPNLAQSGSWIGVGGMTVALFLYLYSAFVLPSWTHSVLLPAVWLLLFVLAVRWFTRHPYRVLSLPVVALVVWFAVLLRG